MVTSTVMSFGARSRCGTVARGQSRDFRSPTARQASYAVYPCTPSISRAGGSTFSLSSMKTLRSKQAASARRRIARVEDAYDHDGGRRPPTAAGLTGRTDRSDDWVAALDDSNKQDGDGKHQQQV